MIIETNTDEMGQVLREQFANGLTSGRFERTLPTDTPPDLPPEGPELVTVTFDRE